jgi:hypothetical protein
MMKMSLVALIAIPVLAIPAGRAHSHYVAHRTLETAQYPTVEFIPTRQP